jgi:hypothetical protein
MGSVRRRHLRATGAKPTGARHGAGRPAISYLWLPNTVKRVVTRTPHGSAARLEPDAVLKS